MAKLYPEVTSDELRVSHADGIEIYVRNVRPSGVERFEPGRIVILQHGATYSSTAFDVPFAEIDGVCGVPITVALRSKI